MRGGYGARAAGRLSVFWAMILNTDRLRLRPQQLGDGPCLFAILSDRMAMRFWHRPTITRLAVVEELLVEQQTAMENGICRFWTVLEQGDAIGSLDLSLIAQDSAQLGFLFRRDRWGHGLATEAAAAVIAHGFGAMGLNRLASATQMENRGAARVLEKNGFVLVESRSATIASGQRKDCGFYLLTH
jgi:[ribosomal protein S5]-alanine N-acetyltransferase